MNQLIKSYTIVSSYSKEGFLEATIDLSKEVNSCIAQNYQPLGNISVVQEGHGFLACQPMVIYEDPFPRMLIEGIDFGNIDPKFLKPVIIS